MKNVVLESILFPDNGVPKCFSNIELYDKLNDIKVEYKNLDNILEENFKITDKKINYFDGYKDVNLGVSKGTEPITFNFSKNNNGLRCLSIPNPLVQIPLYWYIDENLELLLKMQEQENSIFTSNSKFERYEKQLVIRRGYVDDDEYIIEDLTQKDYYEGIIKKHLISNGKYYQLYIDISNFYGSIYSHLLSWNLDDENEKKIMNNLDVLIRNTNNAETKGILIGPYTSALISELLLSRIDNNINEYITKNNLDVSYVRYSDDYYFYSDSRETLDNDIKYIIEKEVEKYKLALNNDKINIKEFPFLELVTQNTKNIDLLEKTLKKDNENSLEIIEDIISEIYISLNNNITSCKYLLKTLDKKILNKDIDLNKFKNEEITVLLDYLINTMFKYNILCEAISTLIITIINSKESLDITTIITKWITKVQTRKSHIRECINIWIAYIILNFNITFPIIDDFFKDLIFESDLGTILGFEYFFKYKTLISNKQIIKNKLDAIKIDLNQRYGDDWLNAIWFSKYWLLLYINDVRWKTHDIIGFKDTILKKACLDKLSDPILKGKLHIFFVLKDKNINLFKMPYN